MNGLLRHTNNRMLVRYTGGKLLWLREHEPAVFEKTKVFLNPKDYLRFRLTGESGADVSDASGTGLFDVRRRCWAFDLIDRLKLPREIFPTCHESCDVAGTLRSDVAPNEAAGTHGRSQDWAVRKFPESTKGKPMLKQTASILALTAWAVSRCAAAGPAFPLRPSPDGRYLVDTAGKPFFYHADTTWQLPKKATLAIAEEYFDRRVKDGFAAGLHRPRGIRRGRPYPSHRDDRGHDELRDWTCTNATARLLLRRACQKSQGE